MSSPNQPGTIGWFDLTVPNASEVRDFYQKVVGWEATPLSMGVYDDYCVQPPGAANPVAGICHSKGPNADIPPVWLLYINVANLEASLAQVETNGGQALGGTRTLGGYGRMAIIKDPAGAICALFEPAPKS